MNLEEDEAFYFENHEILKKLSFVVNRLEIFRMYIETSGKEGMNEGPLIPISRYVRKLCIWKLSYHTCTYSQMTKKLLN